MTERRGFDDVRISPGTMSPPRHDPWLFSTVPLPNLMRPVGQADRWNHDERQSGCRRHSRHWYDIPGDRPFELPPDLLLPAAGETGENF